MEDNWQVGVDDVDLVLDGWNQRLVGFLTFPSVLSVK